MDNVKDSNISDKPLTQGVILPPTPMTKEVESTSDDTPQEFKLDSDNTFSQGNIPKPKEPESKEKLSEMLKETFENEKEMKKATPSRLVYYLLSVIIVILAVVIIWQLSLQREIKKLASNIQVTIVPSNEVVPTQLKIVSDINVISPEEFEEVVGAIEFNVEIEGLEAISMKIFDDNGIEIGNKLAITTEDSQLAGLTGTLDIDRSPTTNEGYLIVYPANQDVNSSRAKTISLSFQKTFRIDKMTVYGPVKDQLVKGTELRFVGEMKGFQRNSFQYVLKDDSGKALNTGQVVSASDKVTTSFVKFDQTKEIGSLPQGISEVGRIDFYDVGSDTNSAPLLTVPVRFR